MKVFSSVKSPSDHQSFNDISPTVLSSSASLKKWTVDFLVLQFQLSLDDVADPFCAYSEFCGHLAHKEFEIAANAVSHLVEVLWSATNSRHLSRFINQVKLQIRHQNEFNKFQNPPRQNWLNFLPILCCGVVLGFSLLLWRFYNPSLRYSSISESLSKMFDLVLSNFYEMCHLLTSYQPSHPFQKRNCWYWLRLRHTCGTLTALLIKTNF